MNTPNTREVEKHASLAWLEDLQKMASDNENTIKDILSIIPPTLRNKLKDLEWLNPIESSLRFEKVEVLTRFYLKNSIFSIKIIYWGQSLNFFPSSFLPMHPLFFCSSLHRNVSLPETLKNDWDNIVGDEESEFLTQSLKATTLLSADVMQEIKKEITSLGEDALFIFTKAVEWYKAQRRCLKERNDFEKQIRKLKSELDKLKVATEPKT
jgi:hypothetical protein